MRVSCANTLSVSFRPAAAFQARQPKFEIKRRQFGEGEGSVAESDTTASDIISIVVLGPMNPRIHNAHWYRAIGAIDENELQSSLVDPAGSIVSPAFSQFRFSINPTIAIICTTERWEIQSDSEKIWERMTKIASTVFAKLSETPIKIYALNTQKHVPTKSTSVKDVLADAIVKMNLGFPNGKSLASVIQITAIEDDHKVMATAQPSVNNEMSVFVAYNSEYEAPTAPAGGYFDLGRLMSMRLPNHRASADKFTNDVVGAVNIRADAQNQQ